MRWGVVFWTERADGAVLVRKRAPHGLLGGMVEFPSTPWRDTAWSAGEATALAPLATRWVELPGEVRHPFTHFHLRLGVLHGRCDGAAAAGKKTPGVGEPWWCAAGGLPELALPTLMKKVARLVAAVSVAPSLPLALPGAPQPQES